MDGVITFFSSQQVMKAEKIFKKNNLKVTIIPGPREISPNCGVALCFNYSELEQVNKIIKENNIIYEAIHYYPQIKTISKWL